MYFVNIRGNYEIQHCAMIIVKSVCGPIHYRATTKANDDLTYIGLNLSFRSKRKPWYNFIQMHIQTRHTPLEPDAT